MIFRGAGQNIGQTELGFERRNSDETSHMILGIFRDPVEERDGEERRL